VNEVGADRVGEAKCEPEYDRGLSNADIAAELYMSVATVKAHVTRVLSKLDADNRVQVAVLVQDARL
jgi:DNA-binding NarL/FixJ family response regulator